MKDLFTWGCAYVPSTLMWIVILTMQFCRPGKTNKHLKMIQDWNVLPVLKPQAAFPSPGFLRLRPGALMWCLQTALVPWQIIHQILKSWAHVQQHSRVTKISLSGLFGSFDFSNNLFLISRLQKWTTQILRFSMFWSCLYKLMKCSCKTSFVP